MAKIKRDSPEEASSSSPTKWLTTIKSLSVEPAGFLIVISLVISHLIFQNLLMETICRVDLSYPEDECREIINKVNATFKDQEREIQKFAAGLQAYTSAIFSGITLLVVLFVGPWSDKHGRKAPILMSVGGLVLYTIMMLVCYNIMGKVNAMTLLLIAVFPMSFTGGAVVFTMSAYSYISDTTKSKNRTMRTGILSASVRSGTPIGFALGGLLTKVGLKTTYSLLFSVALSICAFLILVFRVQNKPPGDNNDSDEKEDNGPSKTKKKKKSAFIRYNPVIKLWKTLAILFKKRKDRGTFYLLIFVFICYAAPGAGEYSMLYLFVRERLQWNVSDYGFFSMYNWLMSAAGVVLSMFILSKTLKISDPWIGLIAGLSQIGGSTLYAFVSTPLMMYLASATDLLNGTIGVVTRSMLSKTVKPDEVGKLFALLGVLESLLPLITVPTYAMTYKATVTFFAGAFFFLSAAVTLPAEAIFLYFICKGKHKYGDNHHGTDVESGNDGENRDEDDKLLKKMETLEKEASVKLVPTEIFSSKDAVNGLQ